jgi:cytochrome c-type biogenesis protein CcmH
MTVFWTLSGLLAAAALALVLRPLFWRRAGGDVSRSALNVAVYRDQLHELENDLRAGTLAQGDYDRSRLELEKRLLDDIEEGAPLSVSRAGRGIGISLAASIPLLALAVYLAIGNPGAMDSRNRMAQGLGEAEIEAMAQRLAERMQAKPEDTEGWKMLGKSYQVLGRFPEAANAYLRAAEREPRNAQLLADLADVLAMAQGQSMQGEPEKLVLRALQLEPGNLKALALAGTAAFERQDFSGAARLWQRMLAHVPPGSEDARAIQENVDEAQKLAKQTPPAASGKLTGSVRLSPKIAAKAAPEDTVFIFARAAKGPPMPLAVLRKKVRDLPVAFALDDSMAMTPSMKLSAHPRVIVGARVSKSGDAAPQPGDLQGQSAAVANTAQGVTVTIDAELPKN